MKKRAIT